MLNQDTAFELVEPGIFVEMRIHLMLLNLSLLPKLWIRVLLKTTRLMKMVTLFCLESSIWKSAERSPERGTGKKDSAIPASKEATLYPYSCS